VGAGVHTQVFLVYGLEMFEAKWDGAKTAMYGGLYGGRAKRQSKSGRKKISPQRRGGLARKESTCNYVAWAWGLGLAVTWR
jgi:hypothetical protein